MREFSGQAVEEIIFTSLRLALLERGVKSSCRVEDSPPYEWRASISNEVLSKYAVERISLDESSGSIPSMNELFARKVGRSLSDYLAQFA